MMVGDWRQAGSILLATGAVSCVGRSVWMAAWAGVNRAAPAAIIAMQPHKSELSSFINPTPALRIRRPFRNCRALQWKCGQRDQDRSWSCRDMHRRDGIDGHDADRNLVPVGPICLLRQRCPHPRDNDRPLPLDFADLAMTHDGVQSVFKTPILHFSDLAAPPIRLLNSPNHRPLHGDHSQHRLEA